MAVSRGTERMAVTRSRVGAASSPAPAAKRTPPKAATSLDTDGLAPEVDERQRGGIQSIERAFAILEEIARNRDGVGLAELSKRVGLHNSTAFHLVRTMVSLGYVRQIKDGKRYRIGRPLFA